MIVLLREKDRDEVLKFLYQEASFNIFLIGDIEAFGFNKPFQRVYADKDEFGNYLSVFLRYRENAVFYSNESSFNQAYLEIFRRDPFSFISGKEETMKLLEPFLLDFTKSKMYFCKADKMNFSMCESKEKIIEITNVEDFSRLFDLLKDIKEFHSYHQDREEFIESKLTSSQMGITLAINLDGKIVASVATTAETTRSAMVVAVATDSNYRNQGLATILMKELMKRYLIEKKKELCLFYDNPDAGKIYLRLGFEYLGLWSMYKKSNRGSKHEEDKNNY